jgi:hypothetical protein
MAANQSFVIGDSVAIRCTIRVADVLTSPGSTTFLVERPDGTESNPSTVSTSTGQRDCVYVPTQAGYHRVKITGTSPAPFVRERTFYVASSAIS